MRRLHQPEAALQRQVAQLLDAMGLAWCHPPNGGARSAATGAELKRQGVKPGIPDVLIFSRVPLRQDVRGIAIELKTKVGRLSSAQIAWDAALVEAGWLTYVARSLDEVRDVLRSLGWRC